MKSHPTTFNLAARVADAVAGQYRMPAADKDLVRSMRPTGTCQNPSWT